MLNHLKTSLFSAIMLSPFVVLPNASSSLAQVLETSTELTTVCRYDPSTGLPNLFGTSAYLTLTEADGNTSFVLERFPTFVTNPENTEQRADVSAMRSLTLYSTSITEARQLMIDQPFYYAALIGVEVANLDDSYADVDATLGCSQVAANPAPEVPPASAPFEPTIADLPNGNYRFVAAEFPNRVVTDEELLAAGGAFFLFRKFGNTVTGDFTFIDHEGGSCIAGTVEGNTVTGNSHSYSDIVRAGTFLNLGTEVEDGKYEGSVLTLDGFSQINAGTRLPVESCS